MTIVKITVLAWILFFIVRFYVKVTMTNLEALQIGLGKKLKMNFSRWIMVICFLLSVIGTVTSIIWFLFFSGVI